MSGDPPLPGDTNQRKAVRPAPVARDTANAPDRADGFLVVGVGASAGGLDACKKLLAAMPAGNGMAFVLVQHLDPTHESMLVELLASHTTMPVRQVTEGMRPQPDHFYVIPPGTYISISEGLLHVSEPQARHGARMPFDFLLHSLAEAYGQGAACVILSGSGADGSVGLKSVKEKLGLVIAQDPVEAAFDGMPRSAILTGAVDLVLQVAQIPDALIAYNQRIASAGADAGRETDEQPRPWLPVIVALLHQKTGQDFSLYKPGTLQRRIERRMAITVPGGGDMDRYLEILRANPGEVTLLTKDLLIHVTSFFRDPPVFALLAAQIVPALVADRGADRPLRIWVPGCSTGEETYSLAMLFFEQIATGGQGPKLQIFASDVDPDAVATAREGAYPATIEADVSAERLARFFTKQGLGYRVSPELRASVVFTVQDVLADPPFSRMDLISCRNLLIYLLPEAQATVISRFHFALQPGGILLLGGSETIGAADGRFEAVAKSLRIYRRAGPGRLTARGMLAGAGAGAGDYARAPPRPGQGQSQSRQSALADLCRRLVIEAYAPAAVLINRKLECLFTLGPTERYLRVPPGYPTQDLLAMVREETRNKLKSAIQQAIEQRTRVVVGGGLSQYPDDTAGFNIEIRSILSDGEQLMLVCFVDASASEPKPATSRKEPTTPAVAALQKELAAVRAELKDAIRNLQISGEEQRTIYEEALSVNEEYQSANEELVTSKEELQSLNEELTALNGQLHETLERQRATANDLQNVLYSTDIATIFLDDDLRIRFFTPATKALFNVLPADVGRPLADLNSLAADRLLLSDAAAVIRDASPIEREIVAQAGTWYLRRILPYRTENGGVAGVVITFADITERRHTAEALGAAKRQAELANIAKSRFLAAASHDLRQPLQTLVLLQGALAATVVGDREQRLIGRLDETLAAMTGMLDALLDINQIEAGTVRADITTFPVNELFGRMRNEFSVAAQAQSLTLRVVPCGLWIRSDPRLLEQMLRNLLANALKYTRQGKVLLGCRRHGNVLSIKVYDTGIGIAATELQAIFEEYHQLDNPARERGRGLGLGLAIVQRLANMLGHRVRVQSIPGKGSVFAIDVDVMPEAASPPPVPVPVPLPEEAKTDDAHRTGAILVVEDDAEMSGLLARFLTSEGHRPTVAQDGVSALDLVTGGHVRPDLILADFNLPNGINGLELATMVRERLHRQVPVIVLTGDISIDTLRDSALGNCVQLNKPVRLKELARVIQRLLPTAQPTRRPTPPPEHAVDRTGEAVIFVVDDDEQVRDALRSVLEADGRKVEDFATCEAFLAAYRPGGESCLLIDAYLPGMDGLGLLRRLHEDGHRLPSIMITGNSDVPMAVAAMKAGASDFIEKPVGAPELLASVARALEQSRDTSKLTAWRAAAADHVAALTVRQREIMHLVLAGHPSKNIAADLGISQRTVENHRAAIMQKTGAKSLPALARLALAAASNNVDEDSSDIDR